MTRIFKLNELCCAVCAAKAEKAVSKISGVKLANLDFMSGRLFVEADNIDENLIENIKAAIKKIEPDCEVI